jgi:parallel beta-helix repeat protein
MAGGASDAAGKGGLQCGAVVRSSVTLDHDILRCPVDGLIVGAPGITIDLNGHKITGTTGDGSGAPSDCDCGISDQAGFDRVTVRDGEIDDFDSGVVVAHARGVLVQGLTAGNQYNDGVSFNDGSSDGTVSDSTVANSYRGVVVRDSDGIAVKNSSLQNIQHAGVALFRSTNVVIQDVSADLRGGDYGVEVVNSSHNLVTRNSITRWGGDGIVIVDQPQEGSGAAAANAITSNDLRNGSTGIELFEIDGGTVRDNVVKDNAVLHTSDNGILVDAATSIDGSGGFPFNYLVGVGPSGTLIDGNTASRNKLDGIHVDASGNVLKDNVADRNGGYGIFAFPGNTDAGGNSAEGNGQPAQCVGVQCS